MTKNTERRQVVTSAAERAVPDHVSAELTDIVSSAREGLLAFAVGTGLQVMRQIMDEQVAALCGPRGKHNPDRRGYRHGRGAQGLIEDQVTFLRHCFLDPAPILSAAAEEGP